MISRHILLVLVFLVVAAGASFAQQTTGGIEGYVTDPDGRVTVGVTVSIQHVDTGFTRTTISNMDGRYQLVAIPPGEYVLNADLPGFESSSNQLQVSLGEIERADIEMSLGAFAGAIEVQDSELRPNASDLSSRVPLAIEATQVALLQPGVIPGADQFDPTVHDFPIDCPPMWSDPLSGWGTPGQLVMSIGGASVAENSYQLNGLNITDASTGLGASFVPLEFVDHVRVETGGLRADTGGSFGGVITMVTKRGTNILKGSLSAYWRPESLQGQQPNTLWDLNQNEQREGYEVNASLGGPLYRDRLFFFLFGRYVEGESLELHNTRGIREEFSDPYWGGRLDWNLGLGHHLEGTWFSDNVQVHKTRFNYDPDTGNEFKPLPGTSDRGGGTATIRYTGMLRPDLLLSAQVGGNRFNRTNSSEGDECPYAIQAIPISGGRFVYGPIGCWVHGIIGSWEDTRRVARIDADWLIGRHSLRVGASLEDIEPNADEMFSGGVRYVSGPNAGMYPELPDDTSLVRTEHLSNGGDFRTRVLSAYIHDNWALGRRTRLDLGLRWERYEYENAHGQQLLDLNDAIAPRLALSWDPTGSGRSALFASAGLYNIPVPAHINYRYGASRHHDLSMHVLDGEILDDGSPTGLGDELYYTVFAEGEVKDPREISASGIDPMTQSELIVGYERLLGPSWSIGFRAVARRLEEAVEDFTINYGLEDAHGVFLYDPEYRMGNPGQGFEGFFDLDGDGVLDPVALSAEALRYPEPARKYYAVIASVERRFRGHWMLHSSYTWSHLYGNYEGLVYTDMTDYIATAWAGMTQSFDFPGMLDHSYGDLPNDRRHMFKVFGSYAFDWGLQIGGSVFYSTGRPVNSLGMHPADKWALYYVGGAFFTDFAPQPRGCCGHTDDLWSMDLMLRYDFRAAGIDWYLRADAFNVFDNGTITGVDEISEWSPGTAPNSTFGVPTAYQAPRTIRIGAGLSF